MTTWMVILSLLAFFAAICLIGAAAAKTLIERLHSSGPAAQRSVRWESAAAATVRPLVVLGISFAGYQVLMRMPIALSTKALWLEGMRAWLILWVVLSAWGVAEGISILFYELRGKAIPVPPLIRNIVRGVVALAVTFALLKYNLGVNISPLLASTALITAVVGLALQGVLGNLMAGMSLHLVRSVVPGDWVRIDDVEGQVVEMNWRETRLRTNGGHYIILPNSRVAGAQIHNMTYPDRRRRHEMTIPIRCTIAPELVAAEVAAAAAAVQGVLQDPAPTVRISGFKDYAVEYRLRFWSEQYYNRVPLEGDVARMIWYRLRRHGIDLPFPIANEWLAELRHIWSQPEAGYTEEMRRRTDDLKRSELMSKWLIDDQGEPLIGHRDLERLAEHVRRIRFATGEILFRQGEPGTACYVVVKGRLTGTMEFSDAPDPVRFEVGPGSVVGEMSLVTRLPRTATLTAAEETEVLEIPETAFQRLLALRPDVPQRLAVIVAERAAANMATLQRLKNIAAETARESLTRKSILDRLLHLLGCGS